MKLSRCVLPDHKRPSGGNDFSFSQFAFFPGPSRILVLGSSKTKSALYPIDPRWEPSYRFVSDVSGEVILGCKMGGEELQLIFPAPLGLYIGF